MFYWWEPSSDSGFSISTGSLCHLPDTMAKQSGSSPSCGADTARWIVGSTYSRGEMTELLEGSQNCLPSLKSSLIDFGGIYQQRRGGGIKGTDCVVLENNFLKVPCALNGMKATAKAAGTLAISWIAIGTRSVSSLLLIVIAIHSVELQSVSETTNIWVQCKCKCCDLEKRFSPSLSPPVFLTFLLLLTLAIGACT